MCTTTHAEMRHTGWRAVFVAVCLNVLQCVAVYLNVLQCVAVYLNVLQCVAVYLHVLQCVAVYLNVLQCVAVYLNVLQCVAVYLNDLQKCVIQGGVQYIYIYYGVATISRLLRIIGLFCKRAI